MSRIERGLRNPTPEVLARIAEILGCAVAEIAPADRARPEYPGPV